MTSYNRTENDGEEILIPIYKIKQFLPKLKELFSHNCV